MANRISTLIEFETQQAKLKLSEFKSSIADADGVGNKFKAGFGSVSDSIKANAGAIAVAGGAALVAFGVKAVGAFTDTAKAAIDLSTATGLSREEASRWIGVGDDFQVSAEDLTSSIGKIGKQLNDTKWAKYGIETHDAAGNAKSANEILIDSLATLSAITNETERARVGNELFGKGFAKLSPLIGHTKTEYEGMLGSVEKGQVITEAEAAKAEKFRLAQDQLGDALHEVTLAAGEQVAGLAPLLVMVAKFITLAGQLEGTLGTTHTSYRDATDALIELGDKVDKSGHSIEWWTSQVMKGNVTVEEMTKQINEADTAHRSVLDTLDGGERSWEMSTKQAAELDKAFQGVTKSEYSVAEASSQARAKISELKGAVDDALGSVGSYELATLKVADAVSALNQKIVDSTKADVDKAAAMRDIRETGIELGKQMADTAGQYATEQGAVEGTTRFYGLQRDALKDMQKQYPELRDEIQKYIDILNNIPGVVNTQVQVSTPHGGAGGKAFADGGMVPGPDGAPVAATVHGGEMVLNKKQQAAVFGGGAGGGGQPIVVNVSGVVGDKAAVIRWVHEGIKQAQRQQGLSSLG